ncbi:hypothetical protein BKA69DRAFT_1098002 [Paraphysoderma sedebokerense]|nr:hypothetical protein BKA69DRAFT_1105873 [Paraphysoderma sedebokerense]KAI9137470.1 hypothetical protein BKA69DRAFT_1098002 [Paraphysoderma sedebokerense]
MFFPFSVVFQSSSTSSVSSVLQNPSVSSPVKSDGLAKECMDYCIALSSYADHYSFLKEYSHNHRVLYVIKDVGTRPNGTRILVDRLVFAGIVKCEFEDGTHLVSFCTACSHLPDETVATLLHQQRFPHTLSEQILGKGLHYGQCRHAQVTATLHTRETASNQQKSLLLQYFNRRDLPDPIDLRRVTRPLSTTVIFSRYRSHPINVFVHFGCKKFIGCYKDGRGYFRCLQCRRPPGKYCKHVSSITYTDEEIRCQSSSIVGGASVVSKDAPGIQ